MTLAEICHELGSPKDAMNSALRTALKHGEVHIGSWERVVGIRGKFKRAYHHGPGDTAPKPRCKPRIETYRDYRARNRAQIRHKGHIAAGFVPSMWAALTAR